MDPRIQYTSTADGVNIAFWAMGEGPAQVHVQSPPFSHIQKDLEWPGMRRFYDRLAQRSKVIRYDGRASGLSDRKVDSFSLESQILDLEAVVDRMELQRFALLGFIDGGLIAIKYAARNPERVSKLVLWCTYAEGAALGEPPEVQGLMDVLGRALATEGAAREKHWRMFTEMLAYSTLGFEASELARDWAEYMRVSTGPEAVSAAWTAAIESNVADLLPRIQCPTLVLTSDQIVWLPEQQSRLLAARIPDARLSILTGVSSATWWEQGDLLYRAIDDFLYDDLSLPARAAEAELPTGTVTILFADIVDSTALTERLGDSAFRERARSLDGRLRSLITGGGGTPMKGRLLGDGLMAVFASARQAILAALDCRDAAGRCGLALHLGLHAGDVIHEQENVYGGAVNIAARISALSAPDELLVSDTVRSLARTSAGVRFESRGAHPLKGVTEPVTLFAVDAD